MTRRCAISKSLSEFHAMEARDLEETEDREQGRCRCGRFLAVETNCPICKSCMAKLEEKRK